MAGPAAGIGLGLQVFGQIEANRAERSAVRAQNRLTAKQIEQRKKQAEVEINIFKREADIVLGDEVSRFAKAGIELSNSALLKLGDTRQSIKGEINQIRTSAFNDIDSLKAQSAESRRALRRRQKAAPFQLGATIFSGVADIID